MSSLYSWLSDIGCEQYTTVFEASGYTSVDSLRLVDREIF